MSAVGKWLFTIRISWSDYLAYRLDFFLKFIGPAFIFYFVKYNIWSSVYVSRESAALKGYTLEEMLSYQAFALVVLLFSQSYRGTALAAEIRLGKITSFLLYPFHFWEYHSARFLSFLMLQLAIGAITLISLSSLGLIYIPAPQVLASGFSLCILVAILWFVFNFLTGILAFWMEETWVFRVILILLTQFLSGSIVPLDFFPDWAVDILNLTPFPYLTYYPVSILMNRSTDLLIPSFALAVWSFVFIGLGVFLWRRGIRNYSAAGM